MLTVYIGIALGIIYSLFKEDFDLKVLILHGIIGALIASFVVIVLFSWMLPIETELKVSTVVEIENLQDNNGVAGNFYLGFGNIQGTMNYMYYHKMENGRFKLDILNYNEATIDFTEEKPRIDKHEMIRTDAFINRFVFKSVMNTYPKYVIYVPYGTIKMNYNLDAK